MSELVLVASIDEVLAMTEACFFAYQGIEYEASIGRDGIQYRQRKAPRQAFVYRDWVIRWDILPRAVANAENTPLHAKFRADFLKSARENSIEFPRTSGELQALAEGARIILRGSPELLLEVLGTRREQKIVIRAILSGKIGATRGTAIKVKRLMSGAVEGLTPCELKLFNVLKRRVAA
jgi:hypothetical protein